MLFWTRHTIRKLYNLCFLDEAMDEDITRKVIVINDKFQGIDREVSVYSSELLLSPHFLSEGKGFFTKYCLFRGCR